MGVRLRIVAFWTRRAAQKIWALFDCTPKKQPPTRCHIPVTIFPQKYDFSCTASVLQAVVHCRTGKKIGHDEAVDLTKCRPNGAQLSRIATAARRVCGGRSMTLKNIRAARSALKAGRLVISCDNRSWGEPHAILLVGATPKGIYVADSNLSKVRLNCPWGEFGLRPLRQTQKKSAALKPWWLNLPKAKRKMVEPRPLDHVSVAGLFEIESILVWRERRETRPERGSSRVHINERRF